jgi:Rod binding domain-containing protein
MNPSGTVMISGPHSLPGGKITAPQSADAAQIAKLRQAAQDFEAMALGELLQPMFDTVDTSGGAFGEGAAEAAWKPMMVQAIGKQIATHGGLGLAAPVLAAMLRTQEAGHER